MQKTIGIIGGITYLSTTEYYRLINERIQAKLGGIHSAKVILYSVDFAQLKGFQNANRWDLVAQTSI